MEICALSSGSSGNCFLISNNEKSILIDAGISCKKIEKSFEMVGKNISSLNGIFITHEHSDHIIGADVLARKYNIPIFTTKNLAKNNFVCENKDLIQTITKNDNLLMDGMEIISFPKIHKAIDPVGFSILNPKTGKRASIITDVGNVCENISKQVSCADILFFESNHDEKMLENGKYPYYLKKWISGNDGHLSNTQSALCVLENSKNKMSHLILSHLSEHNNTPEIALRKHQELIKHRKDLNPKILISGNIPTQFFSF